MQMKRSSSRLCVVLVIEIFLVFFFVKSVSTSDLVNITRITALSSTSLQVAWKRLSTKSITGYTVCYQLSSPVNCLNNKTVDGNTLSVIIKGLNEFTKYCVAVFTSSASGDGPDGSLGNEVKVTTYEDKPAKGPTIARIIPTSTSFKITWNKLSTDDSNGIITKYEVCYQLGSKVSNCTMYKAVTGVDNTTTDITGLEPVTMYTVAVRAFTAVGVGPLGDRRSVTTAAGVPSAGPTITSIVAVNSTSLNVTWRRLSIAESNGPIFGYRVCYRVLKQSAGGICSNMRDVSGVNNTRVIITGLTKATTYDVAIRPQSTVGVGPVGNIVTAKTLNEVSTSDLVNITGITALSSTSLQVAWKRLSIESITGYTVCYLLSSPVNCLNNKTVDGNTLSVIIMGLNEFTKYYVAAFASSASGDGPPGNEVEITTYEDNPAKGPTIARIIPTSTSFKITWNKLSTDDSNGIITNYEVCYQLEFKVSNCTMYKAVTGVDNTTTNITGLEPVTMYTVAVRAFTAVGVGPLGDPRTVITAAGVPSAGPTITSIAAVNSTSLNVTWRKLSMAESRGPIFGYRVCYRVLKQSPGGICSNMRNVSGVNNTRVIITGLTKATTYDVAIRPQSTVGFGPVGNIVTAKTLDEVLLPEKPRNVSVSNIEQNSARLSWLPPGRIGSIETVKQFKIIVTKEELQILVVQVSNVNKYVISNLSPYTTYQVFLAAANTRGFGEKASVQFITAEAVPSGLPLNINLSKRSVSSLSFTWEPPEKNKRNGIITNYTVCVSRSDSQPCYTMHVVSDLEVSIHSLNSSTRYYVRFRANTKVGGGNYSKKRGFFTNGRAVQEATKKTPTTLTFSLEIPSERFNHIYLVALKIINCKQLNSTDSYNNEELITYSEARRSAEPQPYIASVLFASGLKSTKFVLGDEIFTSNSVAREFYNGPLEAGTSYSIFQQVFFDEGDYYSTEWSPISKTNDYEDFEKDSEDNKSYLISIIVMAILLAILFFFVACLVCQNRKLKAKLYTKETLSNQDIRNAAMMDVLCERPDNVEGIENNDDMNYDDVRNNNATYTALDRTKNGDDEDHIYTHLNATLERDVSI